MRRLNRAVTGFQATDEDLRQLARMATELARRLESGDARVKLNDMMTVPHLAAAHEGRPVPIDIGEALEFDAFSIGGGDCTRRLSTSSCAVMARRQRPPW